MRTMACDMRNIVKTDLKLSLLEMQTRQQLADLQKEDEDED